MIPESSIPKLEPIANTAGYWTIGVAKGVLVVIVPVLIFSSGAKMIGKIIRGK